MMPHQPLPQTLAVGVHGRSDAGAGDAVHKQMRRLGEDGARPSRVRKRGIEEGDGGAIAMADEKKIAYLFLADQMIKRLGLFMQVARSAWLRQSRRAAVSLAVIDKRGAAHRLGELGGVITPQRHTPQAVMKKDHQRMIPPSRDPLDVQRTGTHFQIIIVPVNTAFLERAIELAVENARAGGGPFGAVIVRDGKILAEGVNMVISTNDPTAHAEVTAIRNASRVLGAFHMPGCEIYSSCEPCPMCLGAIYWAHLDRVYFGATQREASQSEFDDSHIYEQIALPPESRLIPMIHVASGARALAPFRVWMERENRIRY